MEVTLKPKIICASLEGQRIVIEFHHGRSYANREVYNFDTNTWGPLRDHLGFHQFVLPIHQSNADIWTKGWNKIDKADAMVALTEEYDDDYAYPQGNYRCPQCGKRGECRIEVREWAKVDDEGNVNDTESDGYTWNEDTRAKCADCNFEGTVGDFNPEVLAAYCPKGEWK